MALLQPTTAIYHHPLDSAATDETVQSTTWTQTGGSFGAAKIGDGLLPATGQGDMTGPGGSYDTTIGSTKLAFTSWTQDPSTEASIAGYAVGGDEGGNVTTIDKLTFATDNVAVIVSGTTVTRREFVAGFASDLAGYATGGTTGGGSPTRFSTIDKLLFSDDSVAVITSGLTGTRSSGVAGFESITAGYSCGGTVQNSPTISLTTIDKLLFSDDSVATITSGLTGTRGVGLAGFDSATAGYACGGATTTANLGLDVIDKLVFSTDNVAVITSTLTGTQCKGVSGFASHLAGYACGGLRNPGSTKIDAIDKLSFSNDSVAANTSSLTGTRRSGFPDGFESGAAGYACGGLADVTVDTIDKLTFSDDNVAAITSTLTGLRLQGVAFGS